ncbi:MAG: Trk family potassium uptake protein [Oscillospiraceae bacterium]|jgi:trk system potassium uptake protein TrkH|nr:Trk family potassium uptake protein [Oscillospiraceae bacterium]
MNMKQWTATRTIAVGFAFIILVGGVLLSLPIANRNGEFIPFLNALFTSASATCVTGLVVYDTWTQFSVFGQTVILLLIQIGGLGFMAIAILFSLVVGRRIGLRERSLLAEAVSATQVGGVIRLVRRMLIGTALFEGVGAALLSVRFIPEFGWGRGLWYSVFHSISAFCNAGFDLMGFRAPSSSLTYFYNDPVVVLTIATLIVVGGIGFVVWNELIESRFCFGKLRLHSRAVLISTFTLLMVGMLLFLLLERDGVFSAMSIQERILSAFFQSVSPRTAGFNTVDIAALSDGSKFITMILMFIGAAPGGTGGGIKVTTMVVMAATVLASLRNREDVSIWHFRLETEILRRAFCGVSVYLAMTVCGVLVLCAQGQLFTDAAFECLSAIGTVGLSTGITQTLPPLSRIVIVLLMYAGRVGSLTVFLAVARSNNGGKLRNPIGKVIVG